jgi:iron complex transport system permease protein
VKATLAEGRSPLDARALATRLAALTALLAACVAVAVLVGAGDVPLGALFGRSELDDVARTILFRVRVPRVLLAAVLGGALTVAGVAFQALLRNPLADPYVLGVSGGASIGGVIALMLGLGSALGGIAVPALAFVGALGALVLIEWVATVGGRLTVYNVLLTGAIFNAFSAALIYFLQSVASLRELHAIVFYLMGRIGSPAPWRLAAIAATVVAITALLWSMARDFNALSLGEEGAMHVGVDVERLKRRTLVLGSLLTGLAVAVAGLVGFVGLVVPHLLRIVLGPDHRMLVPAGFLGGAAFLVLADMLSRVLIAPSELPVGVVTALVGGPFFLYLMRRSRGRHGFG